MARRRPAPTVLVLSLLLLQPALVLASDGQAPAPEGRIVPAGTVVLFDEAHYPVYTVNPGNPDGYGSGNQPRGAYAAYAGILEKAGMTVKTLDFGNTLDSSTLSGVKVLVIVCSRGADPNTGETKTYTGAELDAIVKFTRNGGGLFLIGDHTTFPPVIFPVADKFGIAFGEKLLHDPVVSHHVQNASNGQPSDPGGDVFIVFERDRGSFADHPIMNNVNRVELYRTDIFTGLPAEAVPLINSDTDTYYSTVDDRDGQNYCPNAVVSAAIPSNTTAGAGRVVVVGDTNLFETDENRDDEDTDMDLFDSDNALFGLQAVEWLADVPEHFAVDIYSASADSYGQHAVTGNVTAGGTVAFDLRVENAGNVADLYELRVAPDRPGWSFGLSFSEVGLMSSEARNLRLTVRAPSDALVGDGCRLAVAAKSRPHPWSNSTVECTAVVPTSRALSLSCPRNQRTVESGLSAQYELWLANRGNLEERVRLEAAGPSGWNPSLETGAVVLGPGQERPLNLSVTPPADALGGTDGAVTVTAFSTDVPEVSASNTTYTKVLQRFALELACPFPRQGIDPGSLASFPVSVTNLGNGNDEVSFALAGGGLWTAYIEPSQFTLPFGGTVQAAAVTRAPARSPANETFTFTVIASSVLEPGAQDRLELQSVVNRMHKFSLELDPPTRYVDPGMSGRFNLTVTSTGNSPETVRIEAEPPGKISLPEVSLATGEAQTVRLDVPVASDAEAWATISVTVKVVSAYNSSTERRAVATVVVNQLHAIRGELVPASISVMPGETKTSELRVRNLGNGPEVASGSFEGEPPGWQAELGSSILNLGYQLSETTPAHVRVPPDAPAGSYELLVNLTDGIGARQLLVLRVEVLRVHNWTATVSPETASGPAGRLVAFTLHLDNRGNSPEPLAISPGGKRAVWVAPGVRATVVNMSAGIEVRLLVRSDPDARPGTYPLELAVMGDDNITRAVAFHLKVREGGTTVSDPPCWLGAVIMIAAVAAAVLVRRRVLWAQREAELEAAPGRGESPEEEAAPGDPGGPLP